MIRTIAIDHALGDDAIAADIRRTVSYALRTRGAAVRLVYVPHAILLRACERVAAGVGMAPFRPTIEGVPCQFSPHDDVAVACVADDDTNFERTPQREIAPRH